MLGKKLLCGSAAGIAALAASWGLAPTRASADDARLVVKPAVYRVEDGGTPGATIQLARHGGWGGRGGYGRGWGWGGYRGYGWRGAYRPFYGRPYYNGGFYGPGIGYGYPAYGYGFGYPGYGYGGYGGGVW